MGRSTPTRRRRGTILVVAAALAAAWCGGCNRDDARPPASVVVRLKDFEVELSKPTVKAGRVVFRLENDGPTVHEFVVARSDVPASDLRIGSDGLSVDEDDPGLDVVGEQEMVKLDHTQDLTIDLQPGHYVVFCNLRGHFMGGMFTDLEVVA